MPKVQNSNEWWSREIYAEPVHAFERGGSEVSFDTKTFTFVCVNFCSISITINPILCENYTSTKVERIYANFNVILVTCCNVFVWLQDRWLWCHSSRWFIKHSRLILLSSELFVHIKQGIYIQFVMTQIMKITYQCNMNFTQSIQCFRNIYILNTILVTIYDYAVMLLLSKCEHL